MADSNTTNLALVKPEVGASTDTWGTKLNTDLDTLDALFNSSPALLLTKGGTGATTASGARTALGIGTIATQAASAVAITGGTIEGTPIGAVTPSTLKGTTLTLTSQIVFPDATTQSTAAGSFTAGVQSISTTSSLTVTYQDHIVKVDATSGAVTVNLFTAVGNTGKRLQIKKTDSGSNAVTIDGATTETIDGGLTAVLYRQYDSLSLVSDGTNWLIA